MIGHLGTRVSALLDGQLSEAESERAWSHVHLCHLCRDVVEREGWIKTRLAGLAASGTGRAPEHLKGSLLTGTSAGPPPVISQRPRRTGLVVLGGSAAGVAVLGVLALGAGSGEVPMPDRRAPVTDLGGISPVEPAPARIPGSVFHPVSARPAR